jgi:hypothetical protein
MGVITVRRFGPCLTEENARRGRRSALPTPTGLMHVCWGGALRLCTPAANRVFDRDGGGDETHRARLVQRDQNVTEI